MHTVEEGKAAFNTMPKPRRIPTRRRQLTKFEIWAWSQVLSFQIGLTAGYIALVYFGIAAIFASVPTLRETSPDGYVFFWAAALAVGAAIAAVGSISRRKTFERIELVGSSVVSLAVGSYATILTFVAYGLGDVSRVSGSAGFVALAIPLLIRTMWLASQALRK